MTNKEFVMEIYPDAYVGSSDTKSKKFFYIVWKKRHGYSGPNGASAPNENEMWSKARQLIEKELLWQLER